MTTPCSLLGRAQAAARNARVAGAPAALWPAPVSSAGRPQPSGTAVSLLATVEVRRLVEIVVVPVEHRSRRRGRRGHDPAPVRRARPALAFLQLQVPKEANRLGVVIGDGHP